MYMLDAKYGLVQSMDCAAQTMDPYFAHAIHGSRVSKGAKYTFADNPWIALRVQTTDCLVCSHVQSKDKLQVSGIALASYVADKPCKDKLQGSGVALAS